MSMPSPQRFLQAGYEDLLSVGDSSLPLASFDFAACHSDALGKPIAWVEDNSVILVEAVHHLRPFEIALSEVEQRQFGPVAAPHKAGPVVALTEKRGDGDAEYSLGFVHNDLRHHAIVVTQPLPPLGRVGQIEP